MKQTVEIDLGQRTLQLETGRLAKQAGGAVLVSCGDARVLVTATAADHPREGINFFPLTVDYREYTYSAGRFPGGYIKREGRPTEKEVLTSRLIDRPIRPLFPAGFKNETQVIAMVLSADPEFDPASLALVGASAALSISEIPFSNTIGAVAVARLNGEWLINPGYEQREEADLKIIVAAANEGIVMVESMANRVSEEAVLEAIRFGHETCRKIISGIHELVEKAGKTKLAVEPPVFDQQLYDDIAERWGDSLAEALDTKKHEKLESQNQVKEVKKQVSAAFEDDEEKAAEAGRLFGRTQGRHLPAVAAERQIASRSAGV